MKTTIEIADPLLDEAQAAAAREGVTLRELVERGLRRVLEEAHDRKPYRMPDASFKGGRGLRPELRDASWEEIRRRAYGDRW